MVLSDSEHIKLHNRKNKGDRYVAADKVFLLKMGESILIPDLNPKHPGKQTGLW